ncbi:uncharacterized protein LOC134177189 [Corticium candelabrum]|uniref:uncharacterized protein LOC134177189 n=1 Tax=Corticium candelabrum TaxID=121492 RepID=UPI002E268BE5|nr:uncharacterized protein LOC134177189 [Corticium candelabrum]
MLITPPTRHVFVSAHSDVKDPTLSGKDQLSYLCSLSTGNIKSRGLPHIFTDRGKLARRLFQLSEGCPSPLPLQGSSDVSRPLTTDVSKPLTTDVSKPLTTDVSKPLTTDVSKPLTTDVPKPLHSMPDHRRYNKRSLSCSLAIPVKKRRTVQTFHKQSDLSVSFVDEPLLCLSPHPAVKSRHV